MTNQIVVVVVVVLFLGLMTGLAAVVASRRSTSGRKQHRGVSSDHEADHASQSCSALDPVLSPEYNMREVAKQSILLEEHLNNKRKRCRDCITKHFLHIIGLSEEAISLAGKDSCDGEDIYCVSAAFYADVFDTWRNGDFEDDKLHISTAEELRKRRKVLMERFASTGGSCSNS